MRYCQQSRLYLDRYASSSVGTGKGSVQFVHLIDQQPFTTQPFALLSRRQSRARCPCLLLSIRPAPWQVSRSRVERRPRTIQGRAGRGHPRPKRVEAASSLWTGSGSTDFISAAAFQPPQLQATGIPRWARRSSAASSCFAAQRRVSRGRRFVYARGCSSSPMVPTDSWENAARPWVKDGEDEEVLQLLPRRVEGASLEVLAQLGHPRAAQLKGLRFRDLFAWLSNSLSSVSRSTPGEAVPLANPAAPEGWRRRASTVTEPDAMALRFRSLRPLARRVWAAVPGLVPCTLLRDAKGTPVLIAAAATVQVGRAFEIGSGWRAADFTRRSGISSVRGICYPS